MTGQAHRVLVIHGPNLNMLGRREPGIYGSDSLADIDARIMDEGKRLGLLVETFQSNHEGAIVDRIQGALGTCAGIVINPAAYTHTSVAIRDALLAVSVPVIEVHLSNIHKRESFRHKSLVSDVAQATLAGFGAQGYLLALQGLARILSQA
ncbi:MAG: type II 3-dehydroquinate dehydratase [Proteobacteria bacterium]|nr:type II 3-dehydroquinate dehydratase [Pseudomonadota bacterium]